MGEDLINSILDAFERSAIGFNRVVPSVVHNSKVTYPPFNVVKGENGKYLVEMALAGFSKDDIKISQNNNFITVEGNKEKVDDREYIVHGIAARQFKREIPVSNGIEVRSAEMKDGILSIALENTEAAVKQIPVL